IRMDSDLRACPADEAIVGTGLEGEPAVSPLDTEIDNRHCHPSARFGRGSDFPPHYERADPEFRLRGTVSILLRRPAIHDLAPDHRHLYFGIADRARIDLEEIVAYQN